MDFIGEALRGKSLVEKTLTNCWLFTKVFHCQSFALLLFSSFTSLGTGGHTREVEPVRGAYL